MAILGWELEEIARLIALVEAQEVDELIYDSEGRYIRIRGHRNTKGANPVVQPSGSPSNVIRVPAAQRILPRLPAADSVEEPPDDEIALTAPMVGIFYRAEKPGAPPLVRVGDHVAVDQTVGVIEAMKVFSEFKSEYEGTVVSIPAQDGHLVQTGAPLFILRKA